VDQPFSIAAIDLIAEEAHENVECIAFDPSLASPHGENQHFPRNHSSRVVHQALEQVVFGSGEAD
jgi:hypothetical protein